MKPPSLADEIRELQHRVLVLEKGESGELDLATRVERLEEFTGINEVASFQILQGDNMAITGIAPGSTGNFTATPLDANGNAIALPAGAQVPKWTSSDTTNAPVVPSADGLSASVSVPSTTAGGSFTLTVDSPDLPNDPKGSATVPINAPQQAAVASFRIDQTS